MGPFIKEAYNFTRELNIVGISTQDINAYDPNILRNPESYNIYKKAAVEYIFSIYNADNNLFVGYNICPKNSTKKFKSS